jgi:hypothetical protein
VFSFAEPLLAEHISACQTILVIIGPNWVNATTEDGRPRLSVENDVARSEIEQAIRLRKHLIPILVGGARVPALDVLPVSLHPLLARNAMSVRDGAGFQADMKLLIAAIECGPEIALKEEASRLDERAKAGDREATRELGKRYEAGLGVPTNRERATELYLRAATMRDNEAKALAKALLELNAWEIEVRRARLDAMQSSHHLAFLDTMRILRAELTAELDRMIDSEQPFEVVKSAFERLSALQQEHSRALQAEHKNAMSAIKHIKP